MKKKITVELSDNKKTYQGRLLGLIDDKEFHCIMKHRSTQNKIFSGETKPLKEIIDSYQNLEGLRLVVALKKIDGKSVLGKKQLFISEKLNYIASQTTDKKIGILGEEDEYYEVTEDCGE